MTQTAPLPSVEWEDGAFRLGRYRFLQHFGSDIAEAHADYPDFILMKDRLNVESYLDMLPRLPRCDSLLELGVMKGGSCVFFNTLLKPKRHLAVDVYRHRTGLDRFAEDVAAEGRDLLVRYDVSQDSTDEIVAIFEERFGTRAEFDLIIDDASHDYALSLASFNALFPRLSVGGVYAIEDWGWAHWPGPFQQAGHPAFDTPALSNLVLHCALAVTGGGGTVAEMVITPHAAFITRGVAPISPDFRIETVVPTRGRVAALL